MRYLKLSFNDMLIPHFYLNSNRSSTTSKNHVDIEKEMDLKSFSHVVYTDVEFLHH